MASVAPCPSIVLGPSAPSSARRRMSTSSAPRDTPRAPPSSGGSRASSAILVRFRGRRLVGERRPRPRSSARTHHPAPAGHRAPGGRLADRGRRDVGRLDPAGLEAHSSRPGSKRIRCALGCSQAARGASTAVAQTGDEGGESAGSTACGSSAAHGSAAAGCGAAALGGIGPAWGRARLGHRAQRHGDRVPPPFALPGEARQLGRRRQVGDAGEAQQQHLGRGSGVGGARTSSIP